MEEGIKRQLLQSLGQFLIVFFTGMAVYKGWNEVVAAGIANAIYQPIIQGVLSVGAIWGLSKVGKP